MNQFIRSLLAKPETQPAIRFPKSIAAGLLILLAANAQAQTTYTWDANGSTAYGTYDWDNYLNWNQPSGFPNATGNVANVIHNPSGFNVDRLVTINLNQAITVGSLRLDDTGSGTDARFTIAAGTAGSLTLNNGGSGAVITSGSDSNTGGTPRINRIEANMTLADNLTVNAYLPTAFGSSTIDLTISGNIGETGGSKSLTKTGTAILTLSGINTYSGATKVSGGKLALGNALALQYSAYDTTDSNGSTIGIDLTGYTTPTLGGLKGSVNLASAFVGGYGSVTELKLNPQSGSVDYSGAIANGAANMKLTKTGAGTQILSGANTYSGDTTISAGTLALGASGSIDNSPIITADGTFDVSAVTGGYQLKAGQTLKGTGTVTGSVTVNNGGTLAAGNSVGTLKINGDLTLAGTAVFELNAPGTADKVTDIGALVYGGYFKVELASGTFASGQSWDLFDFSSQTGMFLNDSTFGTAGDGTYLPTLSGGNTWEFDYGTGTLAIIPEPGALTLVGFGLLGVWVLGRARRRP